MSAMGTPQLAAIMGMCVFFFNDPATTEIYTLSLHDALPIFLLSQLPADFPSSILIVQHMPEGLKWRSEEHTSELQSPMYLLCRLLLEKKKEASLGLRGPVGHLGHAARARPALSP